MGSAVGLLMLLAGSLAVWAGFQGISVSALMQSLMTGKGLPAATTKGVGVVGG